MSAESELWAFVLLKNNSFDFFALAELLKRDWGISCTPKDGRLLFVFGGKKAGVMLLSAPIPDQEVERNYELMAIQQENLLKAIQESPAHLAVTVMGSDSLALKRFLSQILASCCGVADALAVYHFPNVFAAAFYRESFLSEPESFPVLLWVYVGITQEENKHGGYTKGLNHFHHKELELDPVAMSPAEVFDFLLNVAQYLYDGEAHLQAGQTLEHNQQKYQLALRQGRYLNHEEVVAILQT
ncbi:MAG: DUF4261 domain-containing protein [Erysipelotrichaceae bacterium]|nr:DUF4261 domain-containing protein [Erysipelotrichaceae bacterium]